MTNTHKIISVVEYSVMTEAFVVAHGDMTSEDGADFVTVKRGISIRREVRWISSIMNFNKNVGK